MRLLAAVLGLAALAFFVPQLILPVESYANFMGKLGQWLGPVTVSRMQTMGPGVLAGLALLFVAARGGGKSGKGNKDD
jgi:hypothetical protein